MTIDNVFQKALSKHRQMQFVEAADLYRKFLANNPNHLDANYLLGTLYVQSNNFEEGERYLKRAEEINPVSPMVKVNLGNLYKALKKYDQAIECFARAIQLKPDLPQAHFGLGSVLVITDKDEKKALDSYFRALSLAPNIPEIHQAIGRIYFKNGRPEAIDCFETAKSLHPRLPGISKDLGLACLRYAKSQEAVEHLKNATAESPEDIKSRYFLIVAQGGEPDQELKAAYIKEEFDSFASMFDEVLCDKLNYRIPSKLVDLLKECCGEKLLFRNVIDLGCGTGLSGICLRPHSEFLVGIDISEKMLALAVEKGCYDQLLKGSIVEQLNSAEIQFDLFMAADVFIYVGELSQLFETLKTKAHNGTMLLFSTEKCDGEGFVLRPSGRYAHSPFYIHSLAKRYSFEVLGEKSTELRTDGTESIIGDLYLMKLS